MDPLLIAAIVGAVASFAVRFVAPRLSQIVLARMLDPGVVRLKESDPYFNREYARPQKRPDKRARKRPSLSASTPAA